MKRNNPQNLSFPRKIFNNLEKRMIKKKVKVAAAVAVVAAAAAAVTTTVIRVNKNQNKYLKTIS
jgi:hypothetical protein